MALIEFDYDRAISQANRLENVAEDMKRLANSSVNNSLQEINASWTGENATAYIQKGYRLQEQISKTASELMIISESIRRVAERIKRAEDHAKSVVGHGG